VQELSIFGSVVDHSIVGVAIADMRRPDQPLIYVNKAFTLITGYSRDLAVGYNCRFLQGPETDPRELQRIRDAVAAGRPYSGELLNYRLDGTLFWNRLTLYPVGAANGAAESGGGGANPEFYVANQIDISSVKRLTSPPSLPEPLVGGLDQSLDAARAAMKQAIRFGEVLRARLAQTPGSLSVEEEALLRAEVQAHEALQDALEAMRAWLVERSAES
jgi:PAS domain S-box-containing protein